MMSRTEALDELNRRYLKVREMEASGRGDKRHGWGVYEKSRLGTYSHGLRIDGLRSVADIVNGEHYGTLRVLDLAGPGIFVDSSIPVGLIVGVTALNNDERLKESFRFRVVILIKIEK